MTFSLQYHVFYLSLQPGAGRTPFALDGLRGDSERAGGLFHRESAVETQFDDLALTRVAGGEFFERLVKSDEFGRALLYAGKGVVHLRALLAAGPLGCGIRAGIVHQN